MNITSEKKPTVSGIAAISAKIAAALNERHRGQYQNQRQADVNHPPQVRPGNVGCATVSDGPRRLDQRQPRLGFLDVSLLGEMHDAQPALFGQLADDFLVAFGQKLLGPAPPASAAGRESPRATWPAPTRSA